MAAEIKRNEIAAIYKLLNECKNTLKHGNIHTCLLSFRTVLEKIPITSMLPADEKDLMKEVNSFQISLSESKKFKDIFGPVSFHAKDLATSLDFVKQLIQVKEDELRGSIQNSQNNDASIQDIATDITSDIVKEAQTVMELVDQGEFSKAKELIADNDILVTFIVQSYNRNGIHFRREGHYDKAIGEFEKALALLPDDEGLHYNMARVHIEKKEWKRAQESIQEALKINPLFKEGNDLLKYINVKS
ncbi:MAG: tetratricopeptide repeat protein [Syntrophaceae bacterium]